LQVARGFDLQSMLCPDKHWMTVVTRQRRPLHRLITIPDTPDTTAPEGYNEFGRWVSNETNWFS
jgi:hypothetical protein